MSFKVFFSNLICKTLTHGRGPADQVWLWFSPDQPWGPNSVFWPRSGADTDPPRAPPVRMDRNDVRLVGMTIEATTAVYVYVYNYHNGTSNELVGTMTILPPAPGKPIPPNKTYAFQGDHDAEYLLEVSYQLDSDKFVTFTRAYCHKTQSGIDSTLITAIMNASGSIVQAAGDVISKLPNPAAAAVGGALQVAAAAFNSIPLLAAAINASLDSPDQLVITKGAYEDKQNKIFPNETEYRQVHSGDQVDFGFTPMTFQLRDVQQFWLWEADKMSSDDPMGSVIIAETDPLGPKVLALVGPMNQGNIYLLAFVVGSNAVISDPNCLSIDPVTGIARRRTSS